MTTLNSLNLASTAKDVEMCLSYDVIIGIKTGWKRCQLVINDKHMTNL